MFVRRHYLFEIRPHNALTLGGVPVAGSEAARMINEKVEALGEAQAAAAIATIKVATRQVAKKVLSSIKREFTETGSGLQSNL